MYLTETEFFHNSEHVEIQTWFKFKPQIPLLGNIMYTIPSSQVHSIYLIKFIWPAISYKVTLGDVQQRQPLQLDIEIS